MTISNRQFEQMQRCRDQLMSALKQEMDRRSTAYGDQWIENERLALTEAANRWIVAYTEFPTITTAQVEKIEQLAVGHVDYASKLVLYVSELIYGLRPVV